MTVGSAGNEWPRLNRSHRNREWNKNACDLKLAIRNLRLSAGRWYEDQINGREWIGGIVIGGRRDGHAIAQWGKVAMRLAPGVLNTWSRGKSYENRGRGNFNIRDPIASELWCRSFWSTHLISPIAICAIGLSINPFKIFQHVFLSFQLKTFGKWVFGFIKENMIEEGFFSMV